MVNAQCPGLNIAGSIPAPRQPKFIRRWTNVNKEQLVSHVIRRLGVSCHTVGFAYLKAAILMTLDDCTIAQRSLNTIAYPMIADAYKTTPIRVERGIRHAIERAWSRKDRQPLQEVLAPLKIPERRMTNAEFIATVAESLRFQLMEKAG